MQVKHASFCIALKSIDFEYKLNWIEWIFYYY